MSVDERYRPPKQKKTLLLLFLGIFLIAPFAWMQRSAIRVNISNSSIVAAPRGFGARNGEISEQRSLLDAQASSENAATGWMSSALASQGSQHNILEAHRRCQAGNKSDLPNLVTLKQWTSSKSRPRESISILTHLSADRLPMLENQCRAWPDPVIAVVFISIERNETDPDHPIVLNYDETSFDDVVRGISSFHSFMETTASCALRIELVGQYIDPEDKTTEQYPINALRNRVLSLAITELVLVLDVDFIASPMMGLPDPGYRDPAVYNQMVEITNRKKAIVLPAFEITNRRQDLVMAQNFARSLIVAGKEEMKVLYHQGEIDQFNGHDAPWGHNPTNTSRWIDLTQPLLYRAAYEPKYEPFVLLSRQLAPWADERFVGYGGNKIAYMNQLHGLNFTFHVHPYGYAIHVPHPRTHASNVFVAQKRRGESKMEALRAEIEEQILKGSYSPVVRNCKEKPQEEVVIERDPSRSTGADMNESKSPKTDDKKKENPVDVDSSKSNGNESNGTNDDPSRAEKSSKNTEQKNSQPSS